LGKVPFPPIHLQTIHPGNRLRHARAPSLTTQPCTLLKLNTCLQTIQHGACLGLGLAALGTDDDDIFEDIKAVLYQDSAVAGEAAGIALGLLSAGSATEKATELLAYAHDTQHEKAGC